MAPTFGAFYADPEPPEACVGYSRLRDEGQGIATPSTSFEVVQVDISTRVEMHLTSSSTPPRPLSDRRKHAGPRGTSPSLKR
ncbi:uncharacterized protein SCHCODRAFT_02699518 [Schizophyllum commune H4-8]|uniref:uncharacterized protein n=1 Tax=Schizophyllum commune (strain H4-8 / FGSC 9210) TaxID=578458 RepID=UPI00215FB8B8|nr:uncharacterized protein SCHCODRAFT_02699518 [Schizophyllum commune H4-8]KAI5895656.1 hypothetical protein SCHCODRAFT_02699518 [Schizophyllum commune H4-8]